MHYKNGRPAKKGDQVIWLENWSKYGMKGIVVETNAGCEACNVSVLDQHGMRQLLSSKDCVHLDDALNPAPYVDPAAAGTMGAEMPFKVGSGSAPKN